MAHVIFYMHQTNDACGGVCACNCAHQIDKTGTSSKVFVSFEVQF